MRTLLATTAALAMSAAAVLPAAAQTAPATTPPPAATSPSGTPMDKTMTPNRLNPPPSAATRGGEMKQSTAMVPPDLDAQGNHRASKMIGMAVVNDKDQTIGKIDDILIGTDDKANMAVVSVGGFLGIGAKLVAVPFDQLKPAANDPKSLTMPNASKEQLKAMPTYDFGKGA